MNFPGCLGALSMSPLAFLESLFLCQNHTYLVPLISTSSRHDSATTIFHSDDVFRRLMFALYHNFCIEAIKIVLSYLNIAIQILKKVVQLISLGEYVYFGRQISQVVLHKTCE